MHVLVCGGAGYVGAHAVYALVQAGHEVSVLDNFSTGHRQAVRWGRLIEADLLQPWSLDAAFARPVDAVMHFCARSLVGESIARPYDYYDHNLVGTLNLLRAMHQHGVDKLVFSSTAAVFGLPRSARIDEDHPTAPINPYGASKLMVERVLADAAGAYGLRSVALRYFNAAGAAHEAGIGESHTPETHLIPNMLRATLGLAPALQVYGNDYATPDGTCVRDYVHVNDLADAHLRALAALEGATPCAQAFNLGNGAGFSVLKVIEAAQRVTGRAVPFSFAPRRPGDPPSLVAASDRAHAHLGWRPRFDRLDDIVASAWRWHLDPRY